MDYTGRRGDGACEHPFLRGWLEADNGGPMDCIVIDLSASGARVALADAPAIGHHVLLTIPGRYFQQACQVVQRGKDDTFHVAFAPAQRSTMMPKS